MLFEVDGTLHKGNTVLLLNGRRDALSRQPQHSRRFVNPANANSFGIWIALEVDVEAIRNILKLP